MRPSQWEVHLQEGGHCRRARTPASPSTIVRTFALPLRPRQPSAAANVEGEARRRRRPPAMVWRPAARGRRWNSPGRSGGWRSRCRSREDGERGSVSSMSRRRRPDDRASWSGVAVVNSRCRFHGQARCLGGTVEGAAGCASAHQFRSGDGAGAGRHRWPPAAAAEWPHVLGPRVPGVAGGRCRS
jgi:hypothetical protein